MSSVLFVVGFSLALVVSAVSQTATASTGTANTTDDVQLSAGGPYPGTFDCPMRGLALEFAQSIQPWLAVDQLQEIADALNGSPEKQPKNCTVSPSMLNLAHSPKVRQPPTWNSDSNSDSNSNSDSKFHVRVYVDSRRDKGRDALSAGAGSVSGSVTHPFRTVQYAVDYIRELRATAQLPKSSMAAIILRAGTHYLRDTIHLSALDSHLVISNFDGEAAVVSGAVPLPTDLQWVRYQNDSNADSHFDFYYAQIPESVNLTAIMGLRMNGSRAIRARYPNANPEVYPPGFGSTMRAIKWLPPIASNPQPHTLVRPAEPFRATDAKGYFQYYNLGVGGTSCFNFFPDGGYWCSNMTQGGGAFTYRIPTGLQYNAAQLPHAPYANTQGGIIQTWRPGHWSSWMFEIGTYTSANQTMTFSSGGFQGARGNNNGEDYFVENVFEELDARAEWFFNESTRVLYFRSNASNESPSQSNILFEATKLQVLVNMTGTMAAPVQNIALRGLTFKDTAITYMEPHGMPSGGDWGLQRTGSLFLDGCENITIAENLFTRLDNIAISINRYNRRVTVYKNEMVWLGASAITQWGDTQGVTFANTKTTMGWDGTNGNQPRGSNISFNFVHELGIWEKQSSFYFQAKSCQSTVHGNIFFNGPRAGINFNDGFGGASKVQKNLLFNTCRESGDHGPFNSWDRQVYVTAVMNGTATYVKAYDEITENFFVSNYQGIWAVDNDDCSSYYNVHKNFLVYATGGLKNNFGGHNIHHYNNIYGYVQNGCFFANNGNNEQLPGFNDWYFNNTCVLNSKTVSAYGSFSSCTGNQNQWPIFGNNTIYNVNQTNADSVLGLCGVNEAQFQAQYKNDYGTQVFGPKDLDDASILAQAKALIF